MNSESFCSSDLSGITSLIQIAVYTSLLLSTANLFYVQMSQLFLLGLLQA